MAAHAADCLALPWLLTCVLGLYKAGIWAHARLTRLAPLPAAPTDSEVVQIASGGLTPHCDTTGDNLLDFWGYHLSVGTCIGILMAFYVLFHVGSYLALSKLYKQKR